MKRIKPVVLLFLTAAILLSLSGCIMIPQYESYDFSVDEVISIQFYDLRKPEDRGDFHQAVDSIDPVYTVSDEDTGKFLKDFSRLTFEDTIIITIAAVDPSFSFGQWVVRINFTNGNYTFYSCAGYGATFDSEGEWISDTHFSCDDEQLALLIRKYYEFEP